MSEIEGTRPMPEYLRKLLEERQHEIVLFDYPTFDEDAAALRRQWLREEGLKLQVRRPHSMIVITDCS